jgi:hypothetical protein
MWSTRRYWARGGISISTSLSTQPQKAGLLDPGVQVAHHRLQVDHPLALEGHDQPQHAVGRRVVRPHVDRQHLLVGLEPRLSELGFGLRLEGVDEVRRGVLELARDSALGDIRLVSERVVGHHSNQRGASISLCV